jgi:hypothetical protein
MLTFPALLHHVYQQVADPQDESRPMNRWHMDVWNTSGWDAVDVRAELRLTDGRLLTGRTERLRPSSASPPRPDDDQLVIEIPDMPDDNVAGYALIRETVVRWRDARGLAGWEARKDWARGYNPPAAQVLRQIEGPSISVR